MRFLAQGLQLLHERREVPPSSLDELRRKLSEIGFRAVRIENGVRTEVSASDASLYIFNRDNGSIATFDIVKSSDKGVPPDTGPEPEPEPSKPPGRALVLTGGVLLGVGAAVGLGGGLGFGIPVSRDNATLGEVLDGNPDALTFADADELANRAAMNQTLELMMIGVGGALVLTGAVLLGVGMSKKKQAKTARLQVAPTWGRTGAGLSLSGSF
jgi:hypothetical protein